MGFADDTEQDDLNAHVRSMEKLKTRLAEEIMEINQRLADLETVRTYLEKNRDELRTRFTKLKG